MTRVLIVDDHPIVLQGFRLAVEEAGVAAIFEAGDPVAGYRLFHRVRPEVTVIDLAFRGNALAGLSLLRRMRALEPRARILAFSMHSDPVVVARVLEAGASGYVLKDCPVHEIREAFRAVSAGRPYLPHDLATALSGHEGAPSRMRHGALNAKELQIFFLLREGRDYRDIADRLAIGYRTVVSSCLSIRRKLGVRSRNDFLAMR